MCRQARGDWGFGFGDGTHLKYAPLPLPVVASFLSLLHIPTQMEATGGGGRPDIERRNADFGGNQEGAEGADK